MSVADAVQHHLRTLALTAARAADAVGADVGVIAQLVIDAIDRGNKLLFCGNGGSAADAQHLATEYMVRFRHDRAPVAAIALTTDSSLLTAASNDLGFEHVFARQVAALAAAGDILFLHTTSGQSLNLLAAADAARARGVITVGMLARDGGALRDRVDHAVIVPTDDGAHAQEIQLAIGHAICGVVDAHVRARGAARTDRTHHAARATDASGEAAGQRAPDAAAVALLHEARLEEKRQALFYRALAIAAEEQNDDVLSERLNGLHADEQHHLSRLTVRLVEIGEPVADIGNVPAPAVSLAHWEDVARVRERAEIARYRTLLSYELDERTRATIEQFITAECGHEAELGGKWMDAEP